MINSKATNVAVWSRSWIPNQTISNTKSYIIEEGIILTNNPTFSWFWVLKGDAIDFADQKRSSIYIHVLQMHVYKLIAVANMFDSALPPTPPYPTPPQHSTEKKKKNPPQKQQKEKNTN